MEKKNKKSEQEAIAEQDEDVLIVQEATHLIDGVHSGTIKNVVRENRQGFDYVDIYIDVEDEKGNPMTIKTGFPAYISVNSGFGRFLDEAGMMYKAGDKLSLSEIKTEIIGKEISFQTHTEDNFAKVINKTIRFG